MPIKTAKSLLNKYWKGALPIPIDPKKIAALEGISVQSDKTFSKKELSGELTVRKGNIITIKYNPTDSLKRQRFTIAHELGHYFLGHGNAFRDPKENFSMSHYDYREVSANKFAAEILMPEAAVNVLIKQRKIRDVAELARLFDVSISAMEYRLKNLGFL